jgi:hypothetical protein
VARDPSRDALARDRRNDHARNQPEIIEDRLSDRGG